MRASARQRASDTGTAPDGPTAPRWNDPRRLVTLVALAVLVFGALAAGAMLVSVQHTRDVVDHIVESIEPPAAHLLAAERANDAAQTSLAAAAATTGEDRARLFAAAVRLSEQTSVEWTKYRAVAAGLPGETALADRYEVEQERAQAEAAALLVPIVNSTAPASLPPDQIATHVALSDSLAELQQLYRDEEVRSQATFAEQVRRSQQLLVVAVLLAAAVFVVVTTVSFRRAGRVERDRAQRRGDARLSAFDARLRRALDLVDEDGAAYLVAARGIGEMTSARTSLLVADSADAALTAVGQAPACGVGTAAACPAMRSQATVTFADSEALDACPVLAAHATDPCSATCTPIILGGAPAGLVQLVGPAGRPPAHHGAPDLAVRALRDRLALLQALATFRHQAARDPLTGLLNRRSLAAATDALVASGRRYAVAFGDLDRFKQLNDEHGHDAGDRALRTFASVLADSLRPEDLVCRWGGEEFLVVMPDCDGARAVDAMERVRTNLLLGAIAGTDTSVTVSFGVAESVGSADFDEVVERADQALREAKDRGRDRVVLGGGPLT